jgi:hypothetical protein
VFYHIHFICINALSLLESFAAWNQTVSYNTNKKWKINSQKECIEYKIQGNLWCQEGNWITNYQVFTSKFHLTPQFKNKYNVISYTTCSHIQYVCIYSTNKDTHTHTHTHTYTYVCMYIWKDAWIQAVAEHRFFKSEPNPIVGGGVMKIWPIP